MMNSLRTFSSSNSYLNSDNLDINKKTNTERLIEWMENKPKLWRVSSSFNQKYFSTKIILRSKSKKKKNKSVTI